MPWDPHPGLSPLSELCRCRPAINVPLVTAGLASLSQPPWPALLPAAMAGPAQSPPQDQSSLGHWGLSVWGAATPSPCCKRLEARASRTRGPGSADLSQGAGVAGWGLPGWPPAGAQKATGQFWVWVVRRERELEWKHAGRLPGVVEEDGLSARMSQTHC